MIAVIGAGVTGLCISHNLTALGVDHVVLEAADQPGGVIRTRIIDGRVLEVGPQRTRLTPALGRLLDALGLSDELQQSPPNLPLYIFREGRLRRVPLSLADFIQTDLLSARAKLRALLEPLTARARSDETIAAFFTRRFGDDAYQHLLGPLFGGLYASDPADMLVRHALAPLLREMDAERSIIVRLAKRGFGAMSTPPCSFRNGMQVLTDALYDSVRQNVRLNAPVRSVERSSGSFRLAIPDETITTERVILTCPANTAASLLTDVSQDAAGRLAKLNYNRFAIAYLRADCDLRGMGYQVSFRESLETRGVTFNHALFGGNRTGIYSAFLGGARNPGLAERTEAGIGKLAVAEFKQVTGCDSELLHVERVRVPAWDRSWVALDGLVLPEGIHLCANYESRIGIPGRIAAAGRLAATLEGRPKQEKTD